jgi:hypothetical protein
MKGRDPETAAEWQEAVDGAEFFLLLDSAQQYGLITGAPKVNFDRAEQILAQGRERGITPASREELVRRFVKRAKAN